VSCGGENGSLLRLYSDSTLPNVFSLQSVPDTPFDNRYHCPSSLLSVNMDRFYPRDVVLKRGICLHATATWLAGWLSVTVSIVSKRLNLS